MPFVPVGLVMAVVIAGLLLMTQMISTEGLVTGAFRVIAAVALVCIAVCVAKAVLLPILMAWLVWLKTTMFRAAIIVFGLLAVGFVFLALVSRHWRWLSAPRDRDTGGES